MIGFSTGLSVGGGPFVFEIDTTGSGGAGVGWAGGGSGVWLGEGVCCFGVVFLLLSASSRSDVFVVASAGAFGSDLAAFRFNASRISFSGGVLGFAASVDSAAVP